MSSYLCFHNTVSLQRTQFYSCHIHCEINAFQFKEQQSIYSSLPVLNKIFCNLQATCNCSPTEQSFFLLAISLIYGEDYWCGVLKYLQCHLKTLRLVTEICLS